MKTKNMNKRVEEFATLNYTIVMRYDDEGDVIASIKELDGCVAHGQDAVEALAALESMKRLWIESCLDEGKSVPVPAIESDDLPSGKWLQRVPRTLHKKLTDLAHREGVSLNQYVVSVLAEAVGAQTSITAASNVVSIDAVVGFNAGYICQYGGGLSLKSESRIDSNLLYELHGVVTPESVQNPRMTVIQVKGGLSNAKKEGQEFAYNN
jgi:predicted RNase H-like HicB family nuclease